MSIFWVILVIGLIVVALFFRNYLVAKRRGVGVFSTPSGVILAIIVICAGLALGILGGMKN